MSRTHRQGHVAIDRRTGLHLRAVLLLLCVASASGSCKWVDSSRELTTLANLQALSAKLRYTAGTSTAVGRKEFDSAVNEYFEDGADPWGNPILFIPAPDGENIFLLISTGSDGTLDVADPEAYLRVARQPSGLPHRKGQDIVLRGSEAVRHGAEK
jgi:type II secretory pathway pseudopilin PulG